MRGGEEAGPAPSLAVASTSAADWAGHPDPWPGTTRSARLVLRDSSRERPGSTRHHPPHHPAGDSSLCRAKGADPERQAWSVAPSEKTSDRALPRRPGRSSGAETGHRPRARPRRSTGSPRRGWRCRSRPGEPRRAVRSWGSSGSTSRWMIPASGPPRAHRRPGCLRSRPRRPAGYRRPGPASPQPPARERAPWPGRCPRPWPRVVERHHVRCHDSSPTEPHSSRKRRSAANVELQPTRPSGRRPGRRTPAFPVDRGEPAAPDDIDVS